jgi:hypothetical protein
MLSVRIASLTREAMELTPAQFWVRHVRLVFAFLHFSRSIAHLC